jgi:hypothetical protein
MRIYFGAALGAVGAAFFVCAVIRIFRSLIFLRRSQRTTATVVHLTAVRHRRGWLMYMPVFRFKTADNESVEIVSTVASTPPAYEIGEQVEVIFLSENPQAARVNSFAEMWLATSVVLFIGVICLAFAFFILQSK